MNRWRLQGPLAVLAWGSLATLVACQAASTPTTPPPVAHTYPRLVAMGDLAGTSDLSGLTGTLENGDPANLLGGVGSGLAWAGGDTFLALPDRGPNARPWNSGVDDTTSYAARFHTLTLTLGANPGPGLPFLLTSTLTGTTLLSATEPLSYGTAPDSTPYFTGRSDAYATGPSGNPQNGRLDPEALCLSADGKSVFVSDEYGPVVYQFDRTTGRRLKAWALPSHFAVPVASGTAAAEINGNSTGRVANKGMEGLTLTPDGRTLVGFVQSPLLQDGGDGGRTNRIVTIDLVTGTTQEYAYDNFVASTGRSYNSSEVLALSNHEFLVLERDGKGKGDGTAAVVKQIYKIDLAGAADVGSLSGEAALKAAAVGKTLFLDLKALLMTEGSLAATEIPAKLEGMALGKDLEIDGVTRHTLWIANDNDFLPALAGPNRFFVIAF